MIGSAQLDIVWQKKYGGTNTETGRTLVATSDGGFIIGGHTFSSDVDVVDNNGSCDYWIIKTDDEGVMEWQTTLGGMQQDYGFTIITTTDGGYAVMGTTSSIDGDITSQHGGASTSDYWLIKLTTAGEIDWQRCYGGTSFDNGYALIQTTNGGYAICGGGGSSDGDMTGQVGGSDYWLLKLSSIGDIEWQKAFGGVGGDTAHSLVQADDGGYVMAGKSGSWDSGVVTGNHGSDDFWIVKADADGELVWQKSLGGTQQDIAQSICKTSDGGYAIAGSTGSNDGDVADFEGTYDYWVIKLNDDGELQWQNSLGGWNDDKAYSIAPTLDGGFVVTGFVMSDDVDVTDYHAGHDIWLVKLDDTGALEWGRALGGAGYEDGHCVLQLNATDYVLTGTSSSIDGDATETNGLEDVWLVKLSLADNIEKIPAENFQVEFSPNPFFAQTICTLKGINAPQLAEFLLTDVQGKTVLRSNIVNGKCVIERGVLAAGVYTYSVMGVSGKLVME